MADAEQVQVLIERVAALQEIGRHEEALPMLQRALAGDPDNPQLLGHLALAYYGTGRNRKALTSANRAAAMDPHNEWPHRIRCGALLNLRKYRQAVEAGEDAVRLDPEGLGSLSVLAEALMRAGKTDEALEVAQRGVELHPDDPTIHRIAGDVHGDLGDWASAEESYRLSLAINPESYSALLGLADALKIQGRHLEAIDIAEKAVRQAPPRSDARQLFWHFLEGYVPGLGLKVFSAFMAFMAIRAVFDPAAGKSIRVLGWFFILFAIFTWSLAIFRARRRRSALRPDLGQLVARELKAQRRSQTRSTLRSVSAAIWIISGLILTILAGVDLRQAVSGGDLTWFVTVPALITFVVLAVYWVKTLGWRLLWMVVRIVWGILSFFLFIIVLIAALDPASAAGDEDRFIAVIIGLAWSVVGLLLHWHRTQTIAPRGD